jgi:siroheme synthase-like protein
VVTVVAVELSPRLRALVDAGAVHWRPREYRAGDLQGAVLAYASTRDPERIELLRDEAARERVLLNVIDVPAACSFIAPAVVDRGALQVAIGTGGASPLLAARLRRTLDAQLGPEYEPLVEILGAVRRALGTHPDRAAILTALLDSPLRELLRRGDRTAVDRLLARVAGEHCTLERLGVEAGA